MTLKEAFDLPCPFAGQQRADRIDKPPPRPNELGGDVEEALLSTHQAIETTGRESPSPFRIAPPRTAARTWRVDKDEVGPVSTVGKLVQLTRRIKQANLDFSARPFRTFG